MTFTPEKCSFITFLKPSHIFLRTIGYERVFRLSQYIGDTQPEAHVNGFSGFSLIALIFTRSGTIVFLTMAKEYKIYFKNRKIVLTKNLKENFLTDFGFFVNYESANELPNLLHFFQNLTSTNALYIIASNTDSIFASLSELFKVVDAAGGLVQNSRGEYLLINRRGIWDLPKGKKDNGEKPNETALREVAEECGISKIELGNLITNTYHTYAENNKTILKITSWFNMKYTGNGELKPQISEDITEARWVPKEQLPNYLNNTYPSIIDVFRISGLV